MKKDVSRYRKRPKSIEMLNEFRSKVTQLDFEWKLFGAFERAIQIVVNAGSLNTIQQQYCLQVLLHCL